MSSEEQADAIAQQQKFWSNPDLVEKFLPFLDVQSTLCLVQSQLGCTLDILQDTENPSIWVKLVGRSLPANNTMLEGHFVWALFEENRAQVVPLVAILKLMKDPNPHILNLLEAIVQKYPEGFGFGIIKLSCPCTTELHSVSLFGFLLLEEVEHVFGSARQEICSVEGSGGFEGLRNMEEPCLAALASRESRQEGKIARLFFTQFYPL